MQTAADQLRERLADIHIEQPTMPVWSNASAAPLNDAAAIREALVSQLVSPVRWSETVGKMYGQGIKTAVEMGPGKVLAGIVRRVERDMGVSATDSAEAMQKAIEVVTGGAE
jgi:[acyl-carrier-protein] S-malonyltransferase